MFPKLFLNRNIPARVKSVIVPPTYILVFLRITEVFRCGMETVIPWIDT